MQNDLSLKQAEADAAAILAMTDAEVLAELEREGTTLDEAVRQVRKVWTAARTEIDIRQRACQA